MALTLSGTNGVVGAGFSITPGGAVAGIVTVGAAVTISESGIEASGIGITCASINEGHIGGRRNFLINGAVQVAQRGTSHTTSAAYGLDRWWQAHGGSATMTQDSTVPSGEGFSYSMKLSNVSGDVAIGQPIELVAAGKQSGFPVGKKITFSFYAKCESGTDGISMYVMFRESKYSSTNQVNFTGTGAAITLTTTWTRHAVTMTIPTCHAGSTMVTFELGGITGTSYFTGFQAELGDQATPFEHRSFGEELSFCQRYYETHNHLTTAKTTDGSVTSQWSTITSNDSNTLVVSTGIIYKVPKRASPTVTLYNSSDTTTASRVNAQGTERTVSATYGGPSALTRIYVTGASSGNYVTFNWEADAEL